MNAQSLRAKFRHSNKKLRRARKLYGRLIFTALNQQPSLLHRCACRAIAAGLYSARTGLVAVKFSLVRIFWRLSPDSDHGGFGWHHWLADHPQWDGIWHHPRSECTT